MTTASMSDPKTIHRHGVDDLSVRSKEQLRRFAHDIERKVVGPMPTRTRMFLDEFFPNPLNLEMEFERGIDCSEINFASVPDSPDREEEMYEGLVSTKRSICAYLIGPPSAWWSEQDCVSLRFHFLRHFQTGCGRDRQA